LSCPGAARAPRGRRTIFFIIPRIYYVYMEEISIIRNVAKMGDRLFVEIPKNQRDIFEGKRVKVTVLPD